MLEIIETIVGSFTGIITGFTSGITEGFSQLIYTTTTEGDKVLSDFAKFGFVFIGLGMAVGIVYFIVKLIRR